MISLFARLGPLNDTRLVGKSLVGELGKRKRRTQWLCAECRARHTRAGTRQQTEFGLQQRPHHRGHREPRRHYSNDAVIGANETWLDPRAGNSGKRWGLRGHDDVEVHDQEVTDVPRISKARGESAEQSERRHAELWEQFEQADPAHAEEGLQAGITAAAPDETIVDYEYDKRLIRDASLLELDYKAILPEAMLRSETDLIMRCLFAAWQASDHEFIRSIPVTTFSEIIKLVQPQRYIKKMGDIHRHISHNLVKALDFTPMRRVVYEYASMINQVLAVRKAGGIALTLGDYMILLRAARDLGNPKMGRMLWSNMLLEGHSPNTFAYNNLMSTLVWSGQHSAGARHKVRVTPFNQASRQREKPLSQFRSYRIGPGGVREFTSKILDEMFARGAYADQDTFRIFMTASAREGDIGSVKAILKKVWNIDVDAIVAGEPESSMSPIHRPVHSPLRPTSSILFTLAHAFGINNDIPAALQVIDFVARHYNLVLKQETWSELYELTFVLSGARLNSAIAHGKDAGHLSRHSMTSLWDTMTSAPYNVRPTISMYNQLIAHMNRHQMVLDMPKMMFKGRAIYRTHRKAAIQRKVELAQANERAATNEHVNIEEVRNSYELADLVRQRDRFWVKRWLRLFLGIQGQHFKNDHHMDMSTRTLPNMLWHWRDDAPSLVKYEMQTGIVEIQFRSNDRMRRSIKIHQKRKAKSHALMDQSPKLVGQTWVVGKPQYPRRLRWRESEAEAERVSRRKGAYRIRS